MSYTHSVLGRNSQIQFFSLTGELTLEEIASMSRDFGSSIDGQLSPVHVIMDVRTLKSHPHNIHDLQKASKQMLGHPQIGFILLVGDNPITRIVAGILAQVTKTNIRMEPNKEQILHYLRTKVAIEPVYESALKELENMLI